MKEFELWLDESGDFHNDADTVERGRNPSFVGGLLVKSGTIGSRQLEAVIPEEQYHANEERDQMRRFEQIAKLVEKHDNRFVVFNNQECIMIIDNNLTYLNIISEGIVRLIKELKGMYGEVHLKVLAAERNNLSPKEYERRLREKIQLKSLEENIAENECELKIALAGKDKRLMFADIVCNTFLTRGSGKFSKEEKQRIEEIYSDREQTLYFSVLESRLKKEFENNLLENRIGAAVFHICFSDNEEQLDSCFLLLKEKFTASTNINIRSEYEVIAADIQRYINDVRDYGQCKRMLVNLQERYIPLLKEYIQKYPEWKYEVLKQDLDIKFYLLTVYTHQGNIEKATSLILECDKEIKKLLPSEDTENYQVKYNTRKVENIINIFDFEEALKSADELVKICKKRKKKKGYDKELAKTYGTRLQIRTFMLRGYMGTKKKKMYKLAVEDYEGAVANFEDENDRGRQYIYRAQLETEYGEYDNALKYLKKALYVEEDSDIDDMAAKLLERRDNYHISAYIRLMAEGAAAGWETAQKMYQPGINTYVEELSNQQELNHPAELIFWKMACYFKCSKRYEDATKYYEKAVKCSFCDNDLTLNIIGLGIELEYHAFLLERKHWGRKEHRRKIQNEWKKITEKTAEIENGEVLSRIFGGQAIDFDSADASYFWEKSRNITY